MNDLYSVMIILMERTAWRLIDLHLCTDKLFRRLVSSSIMASTTYLHGIPDMDGRLSSNEMLSGGLLSHNLNRNKDQPGTRGQGRHGSKKGKRRVRRTPSNKVYLNWPDEKKPSALRKAHIQYHHSHHGNDVYAVETKSEIDLKSFGGVLGFFGVGLIIAGLVVTQLIHTTFGPVGVGVGIYCFAVSTTLVLEKRNSKRKLVFIRDLYQSSMTKKRSNNHENNRLRVDMDEKQPRNEEKITAEAPPPSFAEASETATDDNNVT